MSALSDADRQRIVDVVRRADLLATARDVDGYLALTAPGMVLDGTQGTASGGGLRAALTAIWAAEPAGTRHLTGDVRVTPGDDGTATARSTLSLATDDSAHDVRAVATITQVLRKIEGTWLIARRTVGDGHPST